MAQKMNNEREQEEIRKMAAKLWHEEVLLEQANKQVQEKQWREYLEQQKRISQKKVHASLTKPDLLFFSGPNMKPVWLCKALYAVFIHITLLLVTGEQEVAGVNCTRRGVVETDCG